MPMREILAGINQQPNDKMVTMLAIMNALQAAGQSAEQIANWYYRSRAEERDTREEGRRTEEFNMKLMDEMRRRQAFSQFQGGEAGYLTQKYKNDLAAEQAQARYQALLEQGQELQLEERKGEIEAGGGTAREYGRRKAQSAEELQTLQRKGFEKDLEVTNKKLEALDREEADRQGKAAIRRAVAEIVASNPGIQTPFIITAVHERLDVDPDLYGEVELIAAENSATRAKAMEADSIIEHQKTWENPARAAAAMANRIEAADAATDRNGMPDPGPGIQARLEIAQGIINGNMVPFLKNEKDPVKRIALAQQLSKAARANGPGGAEVNKILQDAALRGKFAESGFSGKQVGDIVPVIEGRDFPVNDILASVMFDPDTNNLNAADLRAATDRGIETAITQYERYAASGENEAALEVLRRTAKNMGLPPEGVKDNRFVPGRTMLDENGMLRALDERGIPYGPSVPAPPVLQENLPIMRYIQRKGAAVLGGEFKLPEVTESGYETHTIKGAGAGVGRYSKSAFSTESVPYMKINGRKYVGEDEIQKALIQSAKGFSSRQSLDAIRKAEQQARLEQLRQMMPSPTGK